jgi:CDP-diacylglycerol--serine O-phosphatidyltransferase
MVSRLPVFSGKQIGTRVPPEMVLPIFVVVVLAVAVLLSYPWHVLAFGTLCYLVSLPFGWLSYRGYERQAAVAESPPVDEAAAVPAEPEREPQVRPPGEAGAAERPARLN